MVSTKESELSGFKTGTVVTETPDSKDSGANTPVLRRRPLVAKRRGDGNGYQEKAESMCHVKTHRKSTKRNKAPGKAPLPLQFHTTAQKLSRAKADIGATLRLSLVHKKQKQGSQEIYLCGRGQVSRRWASAATLKKHLFHMGIHTRKKSHRTLPEPRNT